MKKSLIKIFTVVAIVLVVVGGAKIANDQISQASASTGSSPVCGVNTGWIYSHGTCVNTCDQYHPWDATNHRCSGSWYGGTNYGQVVNPNCQAYYGSNYYFNGQTCEQYTTTANANYYGNPYNGGTQQPVYGTVNYNNLANTYYNNNQNVIYPNNNQVTYPTYPTTPNYNTCYDYCYPSNQNNNYNSAPSVQDYYTITVTTTTYPGNGTPIYLGSYGNGYTNTTNYYGNGYNSGTYYGNNYNNSNYYTGTCYDSCYSSNSGSNVNYYGQNTNYNYLGSTDSDYPSWEDFQDGNYLNYAWYGNNFNYNN